MEQFPLISVERLEWKLFKTWSYFRTVCLWNSCARKIRNLGALFEVIRSAIGSESAVSQTPSKQSIHLCIKTAAPNSIRQQFLVQECSCRFLRVRKSLPQVFEICCRIRTKMILRGTSGKNSESEKNSPISRTSSLCSCGSHSNEHTWFDWRIYDLAINTTMPRQSGNSVRGRTVFQNRGVCGKRFVLPFPHPLHALFCARPNFPAARKAKSASNMRKALPKRLLCRLVPIWKIFDRTCMPYGFMILVWILSKAHPVVVSLLPGKSQCCFPLNPLSL